MVGQPLAGQLAANDPLDPRLNRPSKVYSLKLQAGKAYQIGMVSAELDYFLRLEDARGAELASDDDGGGNLNSRILFPCASDGDYRLVATSAALRGPTGNFTLTAQAMETVFSKQDRLTNADPKDRSRKAPAKTYTVKMQ